MLRSTTPYSNQSAHGSEGGSTVPGEVDVEALRRKGRGWARKGVRRVLEM